jgi:Protein of unknown function (DUF2889)
VIAPAVLAGRSRWERFTEGWTDNTPDDALTHTVRLTEPDAAIEVSAVALPSPTYEIRRAGGRALAGSIDAGALDGLARLAGVRMVGGLTRQVVEATGGAPGTTLVRDAVIEIARLARQVAKLPRREAERAMAAGARACWDLDRAGFADLPDSCFTYSTAGRALFATRSTATAMTADLYSPRPGQSRVFVRTKVARIERAAGRLILFHSMHDNVHGFELTYEVDPASGRIVRADSTTPRLPYAGICSEPQRKIATLVGEVLDAGFGKRLQGLVGGPGGCAQLYDLTADLLRLLQEPAGGRGG